MLVVCPVMFCAWSEARKTAIAANSAGVCPWIGVRRSVVDELPFHPTDTFTQKM
jgi:hypothetical protein